MILGTQEAGCIAECFLNSLVNAVASIKTGNRKYDPSNKYVKLRPFILKEIACSRSHNSFLNNALVGRGIKKHSFLEKGVEIRTFIDALII